MQGSPDTTWLVHPVLWVSRQKKNQKAWERSLDNTPLRERLQHEFALCYTQGDPNKGKLSGHSNFGKASVRQCALWGSQELALSVRVLSKVKDRAWACTVTLVLIWPKRWPSSRHKPIISLLLDAMEQGCYRERYAAVTEQSGITVPLNVSKVIKVTYAHSSLMEIKFLLIFSQYLCSYL